MTTVMSMKKISRNILLLTTVLLGGLMLACTGANESNQND
jgi:hypothetical protein